MINVLYEMLEELETKQKSWSCTCKESVKTAQRIAALREAIFRLEKK